MKRAKRRLLYEKSTWEGGGKVHLKTKLEIHDQSEERANELKEELYEHLKHAIQKNIELNEVFKKVSNNTAKIEVIKKFVSGFLSLVKFFKEIKDLLF